MIFLSWSERCMAFGDIFIRDGVGTVETLTIHFSPIFTVLVQQCI